MRLAVLRVSGPAEWNPEEYLKRFRLQPERVWRAGEQRFPTDKPAKPGFNLTIADASMSTELAEQIRHCLQEYRPALLALRDLGASAILDIGISVEEDKSATSIWWDPSDLTIFVELGLTLEFTAYHTPRSRAPKE
jgi:hypothetical protein